MKVFSHMQTDDYEQVIYCQDKHAKLKAIIVIHDTTLGPALGGLRMWPYKSEAEALEDALRLARGMTYKNSAAGVNLGGGKAVLIGDPATNKSEELFRAFGRYVQSLNGRYITAVDVGTTVKDMNIIHQETDYVIGTSKKGASGNPAPVTAYGIYTGIKATAQEAFGSSSLAERTIAVQGVGNVAFRLCEYLHKEGANLIVSDIDDTAVERAVEKFSAQAVAPDDIYDVDCDIFSPCALGAVLNDHTIPRLKAKAIAGSANNQLANSKHGDLLYKKGIVYAPDFVINAGGVINVADELEPKGYDQQRAMEKVEQIYHNLEKVFAISKRDQIPTYLAADRMAEERIQQFNNHEISF